MVGQQCLGCLKRYRSMSKEVLEISSNYRRRQKPLRGCLGTVALGLAGIYGLAMGRSFGSGTIIDSNGCVWPADTSACTGCFGWIDNKDAPVQNHSYSRVNEKFGDAVRAMWTTLKSQHVWKPCLYMFSSLALNINIHEGLFYWYTDGKGGPLFSKKRLAKEARDLEIHAKIAALGKKVKETAAKASKGCSEASFFRVICKDNGKGMPHDDIPNMLGRVLSGTKYGLKQTRGKFGLGAKMVHAREPILDLQNVKYQLGGSLLS